MRATTPFLLAALATFPLAMALPVGVPPYVGAGTQVDITNFQFSPEVLVVAPGTTVTWVNHGNIHHTATEDNGAWATPVLEQGQSASISLPGPAVYTYHCVFHHGMIGYLVVVV
ncbi:MAG: hypothetical protein LC624_00690 [Halobacteriales archaeon]|nr:hypothetical protein [Halobacteriales archaeon]